MTSRCHLQTTARPSLAMLAHVIRCTMAMVWSMLDGLRLDTHPDKTFIGRISKVFDFPGDHILDSVLSAAGQTVTKMKENATRLYEQKGHRTQATPIGQYLTRRTTWFRGGLGDPDLRGPFLSHPRSGDASQAQPVKRGVPQGLGPVQTQGKGHVAT